MRENRLAQTVEIVSAYVANHHMSPDGVPGFIAAIHAAVLGLDASAPAASPIPEAQEHVPAVSVRKSLASPDVLISMIDGKPYKTLKLHLATHGLTPDEYRARYGLSADYPMVAASYSESRRGIAKAMGLGRRVAHLADAAIGEAKAFAFGDDEKPAANEAVPGADAIAE